MSTDDGWYSATAERFQHYLFLFGMLDPRENPVRRAQEVAKRVEEFSSECALCRGSRQIIDELAAELPHLEEIPSEHRARPFRILRPVIRHLHMDHGLAFPNQSASMGIGVGSVMGLIVGLVLNVVLRQPLIIAAALAIGLFIGLRIGASRDRDMKRRNRVLYS